MSQRKPTRLNCHISAQVKTVREQRGLKQPVLGEILEVSPQQMSRLEKGKNKFSGEQLYRLARAFDLPVSVFYMGYQEEDEELERLKIVLQAPRREWKPATREEQERILLDCWRSLASEEQRDSVLTLLQAFARPVRKR